VAEEVLGDRRAGEPRKEDEDDREAARDGNLVLLEADPDLLPLPARANRHDALAEARPGFDRNRCSEPGSGGENVGVVLAARHRQSGSIDAFAPGVRYLRLRPETFVS
jgi:hypothetical protein